MKSHQRRPHLWNESIAVSNFIYIHDMNTMEVRMFVNYVSKYIEGLMQHR